MNKYLHYPSFHWHDCTFQHLPQQKAAQILNTFMPIETERMRSLELFNGTHYQFSSKYFESPFDCKALTKVLKCYSNKRK